MISKSTIRIQYASGSLIYQENVSCNELRLPLGYLPKLEGWWAERFELSLNEFLQVHGGSSESLTGSMTLKASPKCVKAHERCRQPCCAVVADTSASGNIPCCRIRLKKLKLIVRTHLPRISRRALNRFVLEILLVPWAKVANDIWRGYMYAKRDLTQRIVILALHKMPVLDIPAIVHLFLLP